jgi:hypothetical protein
VSGLLAEAAVIADALTIEMIPSKLDKLLSAIFTVAIAAGVWIEHVGMSEQAEAKEAKANQKTAQLESEAAALQLKLRHLTTQRSLDAQQSVELVASLARFPTLRVNVIPGWATQEVTTFARTLANLLNRTLVIGGAPLKYEGDITPVLLQSADGWIGTIADGITVKYQSDAEPDREFSSELVRLLNTFGIAAIASENVQKPGHVAVFIGAIPAG